MNETKHTSEPWLVDVEVEATFERDGRTETLIEIMGDGRGNTPCYATSEADARRIAAAVNAVKGIPTEALEAGVIDEMRAVLDLANAYIQPGAGIVNHRIMVVLGKLNGVATAPQEPPPEEEEPEMLLRNLYRCPDCGEEWEDEWSCACDDECPNCGARDISPYESEEVGGEPEPKIGERASCSRCRQDIEWDGEAWRDRGADTKCGPPFTRNSGDLEIIQENCTKPHVADR